MLVTFEQLTGLTEAHLTCTSDNRLIHKAMLTAWQSLQKAAKQDGINITIASSFRSFQRQANIWHNKFIGKLPVYDQSNQLIDINNLNDQQKLLAILNFSALPGASRHHWGTDLDVFSADRLPEGKSLQLTADEYAESGYFHSLFTWLKQYAADFDFYFAYDQFRGGFAAEPWHISYKPIAVEFQQSLTIEVLERLFNQTNISGKTAVIDNLELIYNRYITNINPCLLER